MYAITWNPEAAHRLADDWAATWHAPYAVTGPAPDGPYRVGAAT
jgi:hypothetical protein